MNCSPPSPSSGLREHLDATPTDSAPGAAGHGGRDTERQRVGDPSDHDTHVIGEGTPANGIDGARGRLRGGLVGLLVRLPAETFGARRDPNERFGCDSRASRRFGVSDEPSAGGYRGGAATPRAGEHGSRMETGARRLGCVVYRVIAFSRTWLGRRPKVARPPVRATWRDGVIERAAQESAEERATVWRASLQRASAVGCRP